MYNTNNFILFYMSKKGLPTKGDVIEHLGLKSGMFYLALKKNRYLDINFIDEDKRVEFIKLLSEYLGG